jgi:protein-tyrosine phosphatase
VDKGLIIGSAGLFAMEGLPADPNAQSIMAECGLDISHHRGRQLTAAIALATDLILVMDERQKKKCECMVPSIRGRVYLLGHWQPVSSREIPDPYRRGPEAFRRALEQIHRSVADWIPRLIHEQR